MRGLTLLEALIAVAILAVIMTGFLRVWSYSSASAARAADRTDMLENARVAMDSLLINIQLADEITHGNNPVTGMLEGLSLMELNPEGLRQDYMYNYYSQSSPNQASYHRLLLEGNELASRIAELMVTKDGNFLKIYIRTEGDADDALILETAVDIQNKIYNRNRQ